MQIRPFLRADRDQVTDLVNAHVAAVVPGLSVSVQALLSHLERDPGEVVVDPWVVDRVTLVAEDRGSVVAAAHLLRYGADDEVGERYRDAGEIRWLLHRPPATDAADLLAAACHAVFARWQVTRRYADGTLPVPGVYGVPDVWPHVAAVYLRAGFAPAGRIETVYLAVVDALPRPAVAGLEARRTLGTAGTRLTAVRDGTELGHIEVDTVLGDAARLSRWGGWADVGNLYVDPAHRRQGVGSWLLGAAADWLRLAGVTRLLDYASAGEAGYPEFLLRSGFTELTRTERLFETR
jgi:GNAT superfamily N-acetyltransferase